MTNLSKPIPPMGQWLRDIKEFCATNGHEWVIDDTQDYVYCERCDTPKTAQELKP